MKTENKPKNRVVYPEYFAKRKKNLTPGFIKMLEDTANKEAEASDEFGEYKTGTFLHKSAMVTIERENGLWSLHIISEHPIGLPLIKEVRYKYLPDNLMMAQIFPSRSEDKELKGIVLYEVPNNLQAEEETE